MVHKEITHAGHFAQALEVGLHLETGGLELGSPGILLVPGQVVAGVVPGHHHQGLQPDFFDLVGLELGQQVVNAARAFHRGHEDQGVTFLERGPCAFKNQVRPAVGLSVAHEHHSLALPALAAHISKHGLGHA